MESLYGILAFILITTTGSLLMNIALWWNMRDLKAEVYYLQLLSGPDLPTASESLGVDVG